MAAVLAGGAGSALSHWSAASLLKLRAGAGPRTHVISPRRRRNSGAITFHLALLPDDELTETDHIPVTSPGRTILDLARHVSTPALHRMVEAAERLSPWEGPSIPELLGRYPRRAGTRKLRAVLATPLAMTRSEVEARFLYLLDAWGLPRPRMNLVICGFEVDCVWPDRRLVVELDAFGTHGSSAAFERDRKRDRVLQAAGWTVIRITATQLAEEASAIRCDLARLLSS